jgi:hypothetical protein
VLPGDFNNDGRVDAADYTKWRDGLGTTYTQAQYNEWRSHFGQTAGAASASIGYAAPEPAAWLLLFTLLTSGSVVLRRFRQPESIAAD